MTYTAWNPDLITPAMDSVDIATYQYDNTGMLRAEWDPRITPALKTTYDYDAYGHVSTLTPPGVDGWTFNYAPIGTEAASIGRLASVSRPALPSGTATTTIVYGIPLDASSGGPYDMQASDIAPWAQHDIPVAATAIYPGDQTPSGTPPSSYTRATIYYVDNQGQLVNVAAPDGNITTTEYDNIGNEVRSLSAGNRARALASSTDPVQQAAMARILDNQTVYDADGTLLTDTFGPAHLVDLPDGTVRPSRAHTHNVYDENIPTSLASDAPFNLLTTTTQSATPIDGTGDQDQRTTTYAYDIGTDTSGWTFGTPLQTTVDPGSSSHLNLTTTTLYDSHGNLTQRWLPKATAAGTPSGDVDKYKTQFIAYTYDASASDTACQSHPEYAGLACKQGPVAQPSSGPNVPVTQVTKYNMYGQPETTVDTNGSVTRTTNTGYDAAGRPTTSSVATTGTIAGSPTATPTVTTTYDSATGLPYQTSTSSPAQTISRSYDALGRMTSYTDADGNISSFTYDLLDRPSTVYDGKATTTYTYDDVGSEHRGLLTTVSDSAIGTFTATYDHDGNLATQTYPGTLSATYTYDEAGEPTNLTYAKGTGIWPTSPGRYNIHGELTATSSDVWSYGYAYDAAGRLTNTDEVNVFGCIDRQYGFDSDSNRTSLKSKTVGGWSNCPADATGQTPTTYSYDQADRINTTGTTYDELGRTIATPAATSPNGIASTLGYYTNDLVHTITNNSATTTYNIDPNHRVDTFTDSSQTHTNHYTGDTDSPAWTSENTANTNWTRYLEALNGVAASITQAGTITLNLTNLHGDIIGPAATTDTTWNLSTTQTETDEYGLNKTIATNRYDYLGTHRRPKDNSRLQLMGARVYNPDTGRFLQTDPVLGGSANSYDYAAGDPVNNTDLTGKWCIAGIGTTCTRYVKDKYNRTVPVLYRIRQKISDRHRIRWGVLKWLIQNLDQINSVGTRVEYGDTVYEILCDSEGCRPTGRHVYIHMVVDFKVVNGATFGLVTAYCSGAVLCPEWLNETDL